MRQCHEAGELDNCATPELQRKLKLWRPQVLSQQAASTTTCSHCAPGSLLGCCRRNPEGPSFWVLLDTSLKPNGCRTQHVQASLRAQLSNVGKLQLALCYPDHLPTNSTITFQAPHATKSHLQPCDHLPLPRLLPPLLKSPEVSWLAADATEDTSVLVVFRPLLLLLNDLYFYYCLSLL